MLTNVRSIFLKITLYEESGLETTRKPVVFGTAVGYPVSSRQFLPGQHCYHLSSFLMCQNESHVTFLRKLVLVALEIVSNAPG